MRNSYSIIALLSSSILFLMACKTTQPNAKVPSEKEQVEQQFKALLTLAQQGKNAAVAQLIVYRGNDEARKWKTTYDYNNTDEKRKVDRAVIEIIKAIPTGTIYTIGEEMETDEESEGKWYVLKVFTDGRAKDRPIYFAFLKINGKFVLGDIDFY